MITNHPFDLELKIKRMMSWWLQAIPSIESWLRAQPPEFDFCFLKIKIKKFI